MTNLLTAIVTYYCACTACCGPNAKGITASGARVQEGVTIAAPRWVPFGTRVYVDGVGYRTVQDRMSRKYPDRWDVYIADHKAALKAGIGKKQIQILSNEKIQTETKRR